MIDFPSGPTVGQLYTAPNGVTYQWNGTLWLTNSAGGTGAVQAAGGTFTPATGADAVINFATVVSGNTGNWLNTVNGRYTPPPGRYFIQCTNGVQAPIGGNGTWTLAPRKNGVRIPNEGAVGSGGPQFSIPITVGIYVDANGTDYFDWVANCASASMAAQGGQFTAFPLSGLQGPPGPLPAQTGDFLAYSSGVTIPATAAVALPSTILTGNSGNWYNPATGRYTPPAGRYFIRASFFVPTTSSAVGLQVVLRKNGVAVPGSGGGQVPGAAGWWADPAQAAIVDANGTDYFDMTVYAGGAQTGTVQFMAFPIMGLAGPPGPPGPPGNPGVGDFWAYNSASLSGFTANVPAVLLANTVGNGNASGAYTPANGRFTPPAGRYFIFATCVSAASAALQFSIFLRKNGVPIPGAASTETPTTANYFATAKLNVLVDANGTDYFDVTYNPNAAGAAVTFFNFGAAPLNGLIGPPGPAGPPSNILRNFFSGFVHSHPGGNQLLSIGAGQAADSANAAWISSSNAFTKSIATVWAAGAGAGGLGPGLAVAANAWYFPFVAIINGAFDIFFDTTPIPTHIPTGTTAYRRLRAIKLDASNNIVAHIGKGDQTTWATIVADLTAYPGSPSLVPVTVPPGISVQWMGSASVQATAGQYVTVTLVEPGGIAGGVTWFAVAQGTATAPGVGGQARIWTTTNAQLNYTAGGLGSSLTLYTHGWIDDCGRLD